MFFEIKENSYLLCTFDHYVSALLRYQPLRAAAAAAPLTHHCAPVMTLGRSQLRMLPKCRRQKLRRCCDAPLLIRIRLSSRFSAKKSPRIPQLQFELQSCDKWAFINEI